MFTRRQMLRRSAQSLAAASAYAWAEPLLAAPDSRRFKIGACDWSIGKHSDVTALALAKDLGLDGVQVSLGKVGNDMHLRRPDVQAQYRKAVQSTGLEIASLAIGEMNNVPYKSDPRAERWVADSIDAAKALDTPIILLAFFSKGDLKNDKAGTAEVIRRLKKVAPKAEKAGVVLGLESWLDVDEHLHIIDQVASPNVQVYYDVANSTQMGYDIYSEIRRLGRKRICQFHAKENGHLLGQGKVDFKKLRAAIDDIDYRGWLIIEGAVPPGKPMPECYRANRAYLRHLFPPNA